MRRDSTNATGSPRLAFLIPSMDGGGAERVILSLIAASRARGYAIDLLLLSATGELLPLVPPDVRIIDLAGTRMRDAFGALVRYFRSSDALGMQISMWPLSVIGIAAHRAARSGMKLVVSEHCALSRQYAGTSLANRLALKASIRLLYPLADTRIAVAQGVADDMADYTGLPPGEIDVCYNPIEYPSDAAEQDPAIEALWGDADGRILNVGSFKAQKNQALLIKAFASVARHRAAKLMILGEGELHDELVALAHGEGVGDRVIFPGFAMNAWPYYRSSDLFVLSSDYEGLPLVLIEALYCGLRIVSTDCKSGPRELLDNGAYGRLVPCGDADALAMAMKSALGVEPDRDRLKRHALDISQGAVETYLHAMTGRARSFDATQGGGTQ